MVWIALPCRTQELLLWCNHTVLYIGLPELIARNVRVIAQIKYYFSKNAKFSRSLNQLMSESVQTRRFHDSAHLIYGQSSTYCKQKRVEPVLSYFNVESCS